MNARDGLDGAGCGMGRREFLARQVRLIAGCAAAGGFGSLLSSCATLRFVDHELVDGRVVVSRSVFGEADAVLVDPPERLSRPIYLRYLGGSEYLALSTRCTHRGCQVQPDAGRLVCPCHGSEFALDGTVVKGPADRDLLRFVVEADGDRIIIELPASGDQVS